VTDNFRETFGFIRVREDDVIKGAEMRAIVETSDGDERMMGVNIRGEGQGEYRLVRVDND